MIGSEIVCVAERETTYALRCVECARGGTADQIGIGVRVLRGLLYDGLLQANGPAIAASAFSMSDHGRDWLLTHGGAFPHQQALRGHLSPMRYPSAADGYHSIMDVPSDPDVSLVR